ncbi:Membrane metallo-endopeptidase-like 1 [Bulinus truncatus]|nr:Membrane metallo-endopeptidase-like 1 [Bulinus truncatus]
MVSFQISVPDEQRRDSNALYNPMTLAEIQGNYSRHFNWSRYVVELLSSPEVGVTDISESEIIINQCPVYYQKLNDLLDVTPKRTVANYLIWRLVLSLLNFGALGEKYKTLMNNYNKVILGTSSERPRFRTCSTYTVKFMSLAVGRMFVKDHFDMGSKTIVLNMVKGLQNSFDELLEDLDWMDDETKKVAQDKNHFIKSKIGYPEELNNDTYLEEFYSNLTFNKEMFVENIFINERESFYKNLRQLRLPIDKEKWNTPPQTVGASYRSDINQIFLLAGILQPPFFSKTYPKSLNFGGIGVVIGHEITHGFGDKEVNAKLNGVNTQEENIADNGGLKQAYKAYRHGINSQGKDEPKLPGLNF